MPVSVPFSVRPDLNNRFLEKRQRVVDKKDRCVRGHFKCKVSRAHQRDIRRRWLEAYAPNLIEKEEGEDDQSANQDPSDSDGDYDED